MPAMTLTRDGAVFVLTLTNGAKANTLSAPVLDEFFAVLDQLEAVKDNAAVLVTSSDAKFWSNGIDLDWIKTQPHDYFPKFGKLLDQLFYRFATLGLPTIACLNGHTYAGGAILACAMDFRYMRSDRGFFCFPEVDIGIPFSPLMHRVIDWIPDKAALKDLALSGRRIGGEEAARLRVVDAAFPDGELQTQALALARTMAGKDRTTYASIKRGLKADLVVHKP
jgi:enoyl-CoA hydratase/carnithine racemase